MDLTAPELTAIGVAAAAMVGALFTGVVNLVVAIRTTRKVAEVAHSVNSQATAAATKIDTLQTEVAALRLLLSEHKETAALLAQSAATVAVAAEKR